MKSRKSLVVKFGIRNKLEPVKIVAVCVLTVVLLIAPLPYGAMARDHSIKVDGDGNPKSEVSFGLNSTSFDTLQGTVTVNLPDDMESGDTISGTILAEAVGKTPEQQQQNQSELNGYVVDLADQQTPTEKAGNKWTIPPAISSIPLILRDKTGKEVGRSIVPVKPQESTKGDEPNAQKHSGGVNTPAKNQLPSFSQAGKPIPIGGDFDGDFTTTGVKIAGKDVKVLAESPRQVIAQTPSDLKGSADIQVKKKDAVIMQCKFQSVGIKLAANKLNLKSGETTTLTVTVAGLIGLLTPVSFDLVNRSPGTIAMEQGDVQLVTISPSEMGKGTYSATRTLTGIKPGGFSISARVDYKQRQACPVPQPDAPQPAPAVPAPSIPSGQIPPILGNPPPESPIDSDGNPRTGSGPAPPSRPRGQFRVTLNGFLVNHQTVDDALNRDGWGDEVTFTNAVDMIDSTGAMRVVTGSGSSTSVIGETRSGTIRGGTGTDAGGFVTGDGFPSNTAPWRRVTPAGSQIPPAVLFQGEIIQSTNAALIIPTIWESDGPDALRGMFSGAMSRSNADIRSNVARMIREPLALALPSFVRDGRSVGISNTVTLGHGPLGLGEVNDRPIGMVEIGQNQFGFTPKALLLTYDGAQFLSRTDFGRGRGIVPIRYIDDASLQGDYTLFVQVEEIGAATACQGDLTATFNGIATMTTTDDRARGPFSQRLALEVAFTECRGVVRITSFSPISVTFRVAQVSLDNTTTVTLTGGGTGIYEQVSGRVDIPITLRFRHSLESSAYSALARPSDLSMTISSGPGASPGGPVRLSGSGRFIAGLLGGSTGTVSIEGTFTPSPR